MKSNKVQCQNGAFAIFGTTPMCLLHLNWQADKQICDRVPISEEMVQLVNAEGTYGDPAGNKATLAKIVAFTNNAIATEIENETKTNIETKKV